MKFFLARYPCGTNNILINVEPGTEYVAVFHGLKSSDAKKAFALFRTKQNYSSMESFKVHSLGQMYLRT